MARGTRSIAAQDQSKRDVSIPKVVIGVLTWNGYDKARACMASLTTLRSWPISSVVVDNGSSEPEGAKLVAEFGPPFETLRLPDNQAVSGGYNAAIRWASEHDATHILLLNNDTLITDPQMLDSLVKAMAPSVAAVAPVICNGDGSTYSAGGRFSQLSGRSTHHHDPLHADRPYSVPWLDGPCLLVSMEAVRRIGGLDPIFVSYWEDVDWCFRAVRNGLRCLVEPRTSIVHLRGGTIPSAEAEAYDLRNGILFMRRNGGLWGNVSSISFFLLVRSPLHVLRRGRPLTRMASAVRAVGTAIAWNVMDAKRRGRWLIPAAGPSIREMPTSGLDR